jgi:glucose/mannose-6-phosphate isomerase
VDDAVAGGRLGGAPLDTLGLWQVTLGLAEQVEQAAAAARAVEGLPSGDGVAAVVIAGMGGSGMSGDVATAVAADRLPVPLVVVKDYRCPRFVDGRTLVIAVSFSGDTEETLEVVDQAHGQGARLVAVTSGGALAERAAGWGAPVVPADPSIPMPRAGIGAVAVPPLVVLERVGLLDGVTAGVEAAVRQLRWRRDNLADAERLARRIGRTFPVVYGGGALGAVAARRWKTQVNENTKAPAFANVIPELCHNELCGWGQSGDVTRQVFTLVNLRHDHEHPRYGRRFEFDDLVVREVVAGIEEVRAGGDGPLAQLLDLVLVGDVVSLHLAAAQDVDPGPIPVLEDMKRYLASS